MPLILDEFILEIDLFFDNYVINQRFVPISLFHCFLGILTGLYFEAHKLKCVLLTSRGFTCIIILMGCHRTA